MSAREASGRRLEKNAFDFQRKAAERLLKPKKTALLSLRQLSL
jgi:hypothetical protein